MIVVQIDSGEVRNQLETLSRRLANQRPMLAASAGNVRRELQRHFARKNQRPNKLGGRRTNFWSQVRTSTQVGAVTNTQAEVVIGDFRFAQKYYGGTIRAKSAKALTIPVHPAAHGRRASVLERELGLKLFVLGGRGLGNGAWLASATEQGITVYYALKRQVDQPKDPTAAPPPEKIENAATQGAESFLRTIVEESQSGGQNE